MDNIIEKNNIKFLGKKRKRDQIKNDNNNNDNNLRECPICCDNKNEFSSVKFGHVICHNCCDEQLRRNRESYL